jgi:hypothetical protein
MTGRSKVDRVIYGNGLFPHRRIVTLGFAIRERTSDNGYVSVYLRGQSIRHQRLETRFAQHQGGCCGPTARIQELGKQLWLAVGLPTKVPKHRRDDGNDGHTRTCERKFSRIVFLFLFSYYSRYQNTNTENTLFESEHRLRVIKKTYPARMAPRRKLTCQPRHTNKGEGGFSVGGTLATATEKPDRSGKASYPGLYFLTSHLEELTPCAKNVGGGQAHEFRRCRFGRFGGEGNERYIDPATA